MRNCHKRRRNRLLRASRLLLRFFVTLSGFAVISPVCAVAQAPDPPSEGINSGNYNVKQSFEFGYRYTDFTGSRAVYNTFVNLNRGPRLLEHALEMRSLNHKGWLLDDFFLTSFGYGGDPNNVTRLRAYKNKWYNFSGTFRRDRNFWDYNLLANPLNPPNSNPFVPVTFSLHRMETTRRLSDFQLTVLPQSRVRFRAGYSRNIHEGPSISTFHEGTEVLVFQNWKNTLNSYSLGVDFRFLPRTNISYDQFFHASKGDTSWEDRVGVSVLGLPLFFAQLSNGVPVDLGIIFNTAAGQPCAAPIISMVANPPTANATCNGYLLYNRTGRVRTSYPTEHLSFQSSYFSNLDLSGRVVYSSSDNQVFGYREFFQGRVARTNQAQFQITGPTSSKRVSVTADFGATWGVAEKFRVVDTFHFTHFRLPGSFDLTESSLFSTSMLVPANVFTPGPTPPPNCPTITSPGCPQHTTNSPADNVRELLSMFLGQNTKQNQFEMLYDFTRRFGGRLGYRYANRKITEVHMERADLEFFPNLPNRGACAGRPLLPDGSCRATTSDDDSRRTTINEHSMLLGLWTRPTDSLRLSFDLELMSADRSFTRISPRQLQHYRMRGRFKPVEWASWNVAINILEKRNNLAQINHLQHNRSYGFGFAVTPNEAWDVDLGYDFNDLFSQTTICYTGTLRPPGTSPCPTAVALLQQISLYDHDTHSGHFSVRWRPVRRVTAHLGYTIVNATGQTLILTPNAPPGPLGFDYHKPHGGIELELWKGFSWKASWGYYGYNEKAMPDITGSRDFHGNLVTVAIRYAF